MRFCQREFYQINHKILIIVKAQRILFFSSALFYCFLGVYLWGKLLKYANLLCLCFFSAIPGFMEIPQRILCIGGSLLHLSVWNKRYTGPHGSFLHRGISQLLVFLDIVLKVLKNKARERNVKNNQNCCSRACQWNAVGRLMMRMGIKLVEESRKSEFINNCSLEVFNVSHWERLKCSQCFFWVDDI